ncbi:MAG: hypothetical protein IT376_22690 [Polyangiaceae bacterium]|nr:hypothetical protein [Polyangiaceae bacterium]
MECAGILPEGPPRSRLDALAARCAPGTAIAAGSVVVATLAAGQRASAHLVLSDPARCVRGVAAAAPGVEALLLRVTPERGPSASGAGGRDALVGSAGPVCPGAGRHLVEVEVTAGAGEVAAAFAVAE